MENTKKKKRGNRPSAAARRRREELLLGLMSEPLREIAEEAAEEMREYVRVKLIRYFASEKIEEKVYYGRKQYRYEPVTDMTALEHYLKTIFVRSGHIGKDYAAGLILNKKKPAYVFLREVRKVNPEFAQKYDPIWKDAGEELMAFADPMQCVEDACALFDRERIMELLAQNPHTKQMLREMGLVRQEVVDRVPERYVDLYPECRKMMRHFVLHIGPTNSGKTYQAIKALEKAGSGVYLGPLRLLAYEQYERINADGEICSLLTGEERIEKEDAFFTASTIEMADLDRFYVAAVIDEAQMVEDRERGGAWTAAILGLRAAEIHVCASLNAEKVLVRMIEECGDTYEIVRHDRKTPLIAEARCFSFPRDVKKGDALIVFSRKDVHAVAAELKRRGRKCSLIYGALPYDVRHEQAALFASGENEVVAATDAIGMGMNLPIRRVVFLVRDKFDGATSTPTSTSRSPGVPAGSGSTRRGTRPVWMSPSGSGKPSGGRIRRLRRRSFHFRGPCSASTRRSPRSYASGSRRTAARATRRRSRSANSCSRGRWRRTGSTTRSSFTALSRCRSTSATRISMRCLPRCTGGSGAGRILISARGLPRSCPGL